MPSSQPIAAATLAVALAVALTPAASRVAPSGDGGLPSGLRGVVTKSPTRPVCLAGEPCSAPAARVTLAFLRQDRLAARATTDDRGRYRVLLRPGSYEVRGPRLGIGRGIRPAAARVTAGRVTTVNFSLDTGIR